MDKKKRKIWKRIDLGEKIAAWIEHKQNISTKRIVFIVGGPYGFSPAVYNTAHEKLSLSKMTFPHQLFRVMLLESVYRAFNIIKGTKYHK